EIKAIPIIKLLNEKKSTRVERKVDMKEVLIKTSNKFEIIYGEISGGLSPSGLLAENVTR
ncbi:7669_t:CDS:1, partial [Scutellospora calospora]